jgi:dihydrofolate synthase/folylpolyglutamate synthase
VLGESRELILAEKAAVIKGGHAVFGVLEGLEVRAARLALQAGARPWLLDRDFVIEGSPAEMSVRMLREGALVEKAAVAGAGGGPGLPEPGTGRDVRLLERWDDLRLATPALYQVTNAGLAVVAVRLLLGALDEDAVRRTLAQVVVPGRFHKVGDRPLVIADGAHNADGMLALARSLAALGPPAPRVGLLAIMRDKGYDEMLAAILPLLDVVVCTRPSEPRSLTAEELAAAVTRVGAAAASELAEVIVEASPQAALSLARQRAGAEGSVIVTGSLFLLEDLHALIAPSI